MSLKDVVRFVIVTLVKMAQQRAYGELRIVVQGGQIEFVHESRSHRGSLPLSGAEVDHADQLTRTLVA
jgi:hypothetical protein